MSVIIFQTATTGGQEMLQESAELIDLDTNDRSLWIKFDLPNDTVWDTVNRHIGKCTQNLRIIENDTIYDMIVDPHPHREQHHPKTLTIRYQIQAFTKTKYPEEDKNE